MLYILYHTRIYTNLKLNLYLTPVWRAPTGERTHKRCGFLSWSTRAEAAVRWRSSSSSSSGGVEASGVIVV